LAELEMRMATILVIEDDEQVQRYLRYTLEKEGYVVRLACNGEEGIRTYQQEAADLVFCDLFMDQKEGLETIRELLLQFPHARIIAFSGGSSLVPGDYLGHAATFGAVATLSKPLERELLLQTVKDVLSR